MKYFKISFYLSLVLLIFSCGTIKEGFTNQKKNSSDEFLVEKKSPLVMPPEFNELPKPRNEITQNNLEENKIEKLLNSSEKSKISETSGDNVNLEQSLLEKIKNN
ncbi:DUF3035 domain-containing protein [Candidatus Pelagibacter sp.]|nr:DUF3035 domain-containing protein [Candidatus Pelagibacter sp.]